jgi:hypothetical protein
MASGEDYRSALDAYRQAKAAHKERWPAIASLKGDAYVQAAASYAAEKQELANAWQAIRDRRSSGSAAAPAETPLSRPVRGLAREVTQAFWAANLRLEANGAPTPGWEGMPEVRAATVVRAAGGDHAAVRRVLTLTAAMDRARDADALWLAAAALYTDEPWVFDPAALVERRDEVDRLLRAYRVSQRHGPDSTAWRAIGRSLCSPGIVRDAVDGGHGDAVELLVALRREDEFPTLRGPKVGPMWVRMLADPGGATITRLDSLPVAVDVQVKRVSEYLGVSDSHGHSPSQAKSAIQAAWMDDVTTHGCEGPGQLRDTCAALDPALWFWAKWGCTTCESLGRKSPIAAACRHCRFPRRT